MEIELKIRADAQSDVMAELLQVLSCHVSERPFEEPTKSLIANLAEKELPKAKEAFEQIQTVEADPLAFETTKEEEPKQEETVEKKVDLTEEDMRKKAVEFINSYGSRAFKEILNHYNVPKISHPDAMPHWANILADMEAYNA